MARGMVERQCADAWQSLGKQGTRNMQEGSQHKAE